jgi:hypothetical protein
MCKSKEKRREYYRKNNKKILARRKELFELLPEEVQKEKIKRRKEKQKELYKSSYAKRKEYIERAKKYRIKKLEWLLSFYGTDKLKCERCRYSDSFAAIQFHHLNPKQKDSSRDSFSKWIRKLSLESFQEKILNTDLVPLCANCHAELHAGLWSFGNDKNRYKYRQRLSN